GDGHGRTDGIRRALGPRLGSAPENFETSRLLHWPTSDPGTVSATQPVDDAVIAARLPTPLLAFNVGWGAPYAIGLVRHHALGEQAGEGLGEIELADVPQSASPEASV